MKSKDVLNFFYELGKLNSIPRSGFQLLNIPASDIQNVAEHSLHTAQIAYVLGVMEEYENPDSLVTMAIFHDSHESRIGDLHKVARRYIDVDEYSVAKEQYNRIPELSDSLIQMWQEVENNNTTAGIIVKDADYLECALTAKIYMDRGYDKAVDWIDNVINALQTNSAKKLSLMIKDSDPNEWWYGLKKINR